VILFALGLVLGINLGVILGYWLKGRAQRVDTDDLYEPYDPSNLR
jgi:hypothetical protein